MEVRGKTGEACAKDRGEERRGVGMKAVVMWGQSHSLCIQSNIDLNPPSSSYHSSTYKPTALIAISIIGNFHCENLSV